MPEAFESVAGARIPAAILRKRLPETLATVTERQRDVYEEASDSEDTVATLKSFTDLVELCERVETDSGQPCRISARY